ncbi:TRAP transporter substrate-binding protein [Methylobacterium sp. WSM2598]|uniref:TRAP transporter substrate-binding protein n=1 Tax=Methylobacterium sp. WSM2598 TaxID=398261 RepID=UPI00037C1F48|nr:TRAP transporter substrate-binding protein [Methylobacterium sp. WSM2598]
MSRTDGRLRPLSRRALCAAAALALLGGQTLLGGQALAQGPIVLKFSHVTAPDTPKGRGADKFKELAEKYTGGKVKVEVYPNSQLFKDKEEVEALQLGAVQMLAPSLAKFGPLGAKEFEVFDLPYILPDKAALRRVTEGPLGRRLFEKLETKGITGLAYWDNGFKIMSANKPLRLPADFRGLKMRIQSSKVLEAQFRALGAIPQVMAFSEVYQGMQTGVVDGSENTPSNMYTQKHHEVQKYATLSDHGYIGYAVITNKKFWDGLPPEVRGQLEKAMAEATAYANEVAGRDNADALEEMRKSGKITFLTLTDEEKAAWRKALEPVTAEMTKRVGKDVIEEFQREARTQ